MSDPPPTVENAFTYLANLQLPHAHLLHPQACNPAMDLLALVSPGGTRAPTKGKGKNKDIGPDTRGWTDTKVSLLRMMSNQVWAVDVKGRPLGLAWSTDGLVLSIIIARPALIERQLRKAIFVDHLSVHTGELIKSVSLGVEHAEVEQLAEQPEWPSVAEWREVGARWEKVRNGSALCILAGLPEPKAVDPPKPIQLNPFAKPPPPPNPNIPHARLLAFPSLLPANPPADPHVLTIQLGSVTRTLLTGSFLISSTDRSDIEALAETRIAEQVLRVAQSSDKLLGLYNTMLRGLDAVETAWREAAKQNMIWREELETCGSQHGSSRADIHADLLRFLVTGRSNEGVSDWLGAKLTGRTLTKWSDTLDNSLSTMRSTIIGSIVPALERAVIIFEEMRGWQFSYGHSRDLHIDAHGIRHTLLILQGLIKLFNRIRVDVEHELLAAQAWMAWLRYETAKAGASGIDEQPPAASHDFKLTWSFMKNGFVKSALSLYFPDVHPRPPTDELPAKYLHNDRNIEVAKPLKEAVEEALDRLEPDRHTRYDHLKTGATSTESGGRAAASATGAPASAWMDNSAGSMSMSTDGSVDTMSASAMEVEESMAVEVSMDFSRDDGDHSMSMDDSRFGAPGDDNEDEHDHDNDNDSTASYGAEKEEEEEAPRFLELEPWVWVNSLLKTSEAVIRNAVPLDSDKTREVERIADSSKGKLANTVRSRTTADARWVARISHDRTCIIIAVQPFLVQPKKVKSAYKLYATCMAPEEEPMPPKEHGAWRGAVVPLLGGAEQGRIVAMEFFDDLELAVISAEEGQQRLMTVEYGVVTAGAVDIPREAWAGSGVLLDCVEGWLSDPTTAARCRFDIPIRRSRTLELPSPPASSGNIDDTASDISLAPNGRKGRRVGCVMVRGQKDIAVWDMEVDQGQGGVEEDEDGEESME